MGLSERYVAESVIDIISIPSFGDPAQAIFPVAIPASIPEQTCDVLVLGGGLSGVAAALACSQHDTTVVVIEETDWIGGQLTSQGISTLAEHEYMGFFGGTSRYYRLREGIMRHSRTDNPLNAALGSLQELIQEPLMRRRSRIELRSKTVGVTMADDRIESVIVVNLVTGTYTRYLPVIVIDATEFGEVIALGEVSHVIGAESRSTTGEPHAALAASTQRVQGITYSTVMGPGSGCDNSIIGWPGDSHSDASMLSAGNEVCAVVLQKAKQFSLSSERQQHEQAYPDHSDPQPCIQLASDYFQTSDGLSKHPYVRESRRIVSMRCITEGDLSIDVVPGPSAAPTMSDSVGIGWHPIAVPSIQGSDEINVSTLPFQIPLGALIPIIAPNLLAAGKNIGTTHITSDCYRSHPIEWAIGEAAGMAAVVASRHRVTVQSLTEDETLTRQVQHGLIDAGVPLIWVRDIPIHHPAFPKIQRAGVEGRIDANELHLCAHYLPWEILRAFGIGT